MMIRQLSEADRKQTVQLLAQAPEYNLYILGNLASIGFGQKGVSEYWGDFSRSGKLRAVLNRYRTGWAVYGEPDADWVELGRVVEQHSVTAQRLQDNPGGIPSFLPYMSFYKPNKVSTQQLMALENHAFTPVVSPEAITVRRASLEDLPSLIEFFAEAEHMSRNAAGVEAPIRRTRLWFAEQKGAILSTALTNAEYEHLAMIGGVYTPPMHRGKGYSQAVCSALCAELLEEGKRPVLYWETPAAGAVYRHLGFHMVGGWRSVRF